MRGRCQYSLLVNTQANANTVRDLIVNQTADLGKFDDPDEPNIGPTVQAPRPSIPLWWTVTGSIFFVADGSEATLHNRIVAAWSGGQAIPTSIQPGSQVWSHLCSHVDTITTPCVATMSVK